MANARNFTLPAVWAENADTTIPATPLTGTAYRNDATPDAVVLAGWRYNTEADSAVANYYTYLLGQLGNEFDKRGSAGYIDTLDYEPGALVRGSDNELYRCIGNNGPGTSTQDPSVVGERAGFWVNITSPISRTVEIFDTIGAGTWSPPATLVGQVTIIAYGAGGAGAAANVVTPAGVAAGEEMVVGGSGGGQGAGVEFDRVFTSGQSLSFTIGEGGASGTAGGVNGDPGEDTVVNLEDGGTTMIATAAGGSGGRVVSVTGSTQGANGGTESSSTIPSGGIFTPGAAGSPGVSYFTANNALDYMASGGIGGGVGGGNNQSTGARGGAGLYGAGGTGGGVAASGSTGGGGSPRSYDAGGGANGAVIIIYHTQA